MCYSVINPCGYWTSGTLSALVSNRNTLYNVMGVKRHVMPVDLPQSVSTDQWSWDKPYCLGCKQWCLMFQFGWEQALLEMCISKHCHKATGFLLWIGTYCISCVVQQRSRVKDLFSLVGYDDSCLEEIRHFKSIIRVVQPRPHIRSHSVLFSLWSWHCVLCVRRSFLNPGTLPPCYSRCTVPASERSQVVAVT